MTATKEQIRDFLDNGFSEAVLDNFCYIVSRWQDEKKYEDWADYDEFLRKLIDDNVEDATAKKTTKRPIAVVMDWKGWTVTLKALMRGNSIQISTSAKKN
jgi:hypothetical protein